MGFVDGGVSVGGDTYWRVGRVTGVRESELGEGDPLGCSHLQNGVEEEPHLDDVLEVASASGKVENCERLGG